MVRVWWPHVQLGGVLPQENYKYKQTKKLQPKCENGRSTPQKVIRSWAPPSIYAVHTTSSNRKVTQNFPGWVKTEDFLLTCYRSGQRRLTLGIAEGCTGEGLLVYPAAWNLSRTKDTVLKKCLFQSKFLSCTQYTTFNNIGRGNCVLNQECEQEIHKDVILWNLVDDPLRVAVGLLMKLFPKLFWFGW